MKAREFDVDKVLEGLEIPKYPIAPKGKVDWATLNAYTHRCHATLLEIGHRVKPFGWEVNIMIRGLRDESSMYPADESAYEFEQETLEALRWGLNFIDYVYSLFGIHRHLLGLGFFLSNIRIKEEK